VVLVDTSVWIDYLGDRPGEVSRRFDRLIESGEPFALTPIILQEILQGAKTDKEFQRLRKNLTTQTFLHPADPAETYVAAASIYVRCRRAAITPRGSVDCLIAQIAIEHGAKLFHRDADFDRIARIVPDLVIY
jgi:predicted nucleic acid-binding protein